MQKLWVRPIRWRREHRASAIMTAVPLAWWQWKRTVQARTEEILSHDSVARRQWVIRIPAWLERYGPWKRLDFLRSVTHVLVKDPDGPLLSALGELNDLEALDSSGGDYASADLMPLTHLPMLASLSLIDSPVDSAGLAHLSRVPNLRKLVLRGTPVTDRDAVHLADMEKLQFLNVSATQISDEALRDLARLRSTDEGLRRLDGLNGLRHIDLGKTRVTRQGRRTFRQKHPTVTIN